MNNTTRELVQAQAPEHSGRAYRSKKQRPCDLCRTRKIQCKLRAERADCELCQRLERQCTFVLGPVRRRYRPRVNGDGPATMNASSAGGAFEFRDNTNTATQLSEAHIAEPESEMDMEPDHQHTSMSGRPELQLDMGNGFWLPQVDSHQPFGTREASSLLEHWYTMGSPFGAVDQAADRNEEAAGLGNLTQGPLMGSDSRLFHHAPHQGNTSARLGSQDFQAVSGSASHSSASPASVSRSSCSDWPPDFSLEAKKGYSNHLIGLSCESDPFLLRQYRYNNHDEHHMFRLDFRKISDGTEHQPLQFMMSDEAIWQADIRATEKILSGGDGSEAADAAVLAKIVSQDLGARLIKLYVKLPRPLRLERLLTF